MRLFYGVFVCRNDTCDLRCCMKYACAFFEALSSTTLEQHAYVTILCFLFPVYFDLPYILVTALGRSEVLTNTSIQI